MRLLCIYYYRKVDTHHPHSQCPSLYLEMHLKPLVEIRTKFATTMWMDGWKVASMVEMKVVMKVESMVEPLAAKMVVMRAVRMAG